LKAEQAALQKRIDDALQEQNEHHKVNRSVMSLSFKSPRLLQIILQNALEEECKRNQDQFKKALEASTEFPWLIFLLRLFFIGLLC
jgi:hypothetical protein